MKRHPFDPLSAAFGLLFMGLGAAFMSDEVDVLDIDPRMAVAVVFLFVGILIAGLLVRRPAGESATVSQVPEPDETR